MTEAMSGLLAEAKKNKYSTIKDSLSEDDIASVWENVSNFIEKQMAQQKSVQIPNLGTFTFTQKKLDIGANKYIMIQRPVFNVAEKLAQSQALQYTKHHVPGNIPVIQLNYAALSFESPFDRDAVENCVREIIGAVQRAIGSRRNIELNFNGIGRLSIRDSKVKMKFYKEFINQMDGSGKMLDSMQNRPGTVDSVMSDRCMSRAQSSNTVILPKITHKNSAALAPLPEQNENVEMVADEPVDVEYPLPDAPAEMTVAPPNYVSAQEGMEGEDNEDVNTAAVIRNIEMQGDGPELGTVGPLDTLRNVNMFEDPSKDYSYHFLPGLEEMADYATKKMPQPPSRVGSRMAAPMAMATGVSLLDDLVPSSHTPKSAPSPVSRRASPAPPLDALHKPHPPAQLAPLQRSASFDAMRPGDQVHSPPGSACGHANAGQELCYLCHQRARRNIPVSFTEERKRREDEEDRLLQQYQYMKDAENVLGEQEMTMARRHNLQKMAAFNLGVAEAVHQKKQSRDTDFHKSYIFQRRPLTPPRFIKQEEYSGDLSQQVEVKEKTKAKIKTDEDFLERLEQVQLAEDLAIQREQFMKEKAEEQEKYKNALETQLRFKPLQVPAREPDKEVFGKNDMTNEKMAERRRRAYELFQNQQDFVAQRKRDAILKRLSEQKEEEHVLERTKQEILEDRSNRFHRRTHARRRLEDDWLRASMIKKDRLQEDRVRALSPGILLHEQCDKYNRCGQCKRVMKNCGESNMWSESRYIPGSRLMV